jgi:quercetin dioxygenase-like cupin family protein
MNELRVTHWQGTQPPTRDAIQKEIRAQGLKGYEWSNDAYDEYSPHVHSYDKVLYVLSGSITWILPDTHEEITTQVGDRLDLPRGTVHGAVVGAQGVTCFEAHLDRV